MHPDRWIEPLLRLWDRSVPLLIALALICAIAFGILAVCWFFAIEDAASAFRAYGHWFAIGAVMFGILAGARIIEQRRSKTVHLIAEEQQSFWGQSRQPDGRITTQFAFRLRASNLTDKPIRLLDLRLLRPPVRSSDQEIARHISTVLDPIPPRGLSFASANLTVDRAIGRPGQTITAIVAVSDQEGRWHKVKFEKLQCAAQPRKIVSSPELKGSV